MLLFFYKTSRRIFDNLEFAVAWCACWDLFARLSPQPFLPIRPPRTRVLFGTAPPFIKALNLIRVGPVLVFVGIGRIDDSRYMARTGAHKFNGTFE